MRKLKKLPIGIEDFVEMRMENFYFIDKTLLMKELLENWGKVNLFTRPRRFGKSLNMSMMKAFFEIGCNKALFHGLAIANEQQLCDEYMGQFPVISITLKGVDGLTFEEACGSLRDVIGKEAMRFPFLAESDKLTVMQQNMYKALIEVKHGLFTMPDTALESSLQTLSLLLFRHYAKKVIILIDEYDVPLDKANQHGYYDQMINLIRKLFNNGLKTNESLQFAVMTGCLRVSKESVFTGLNNLMVMSITSTRFNAHFGFTDDEVMELLQYYGLSDFHEVIKEWYDGYLFGNVSVYCPWDVLNYCYELAGLRSSIPDGRMEPKNYWINTSGNAIIRTLLCRAKGQTKAEIEQLVAGEVLEKRIEENLTYKDVNEKIDNIWSVLFATGYLTCEGITDQGLYRLKIPNREIRTIFTSQIMEWFKEASQAEPLKLAAFCDAVQKGDAEAVQSGLTDFLKKTISIRDTAVAKNKKENFYHGILLGLLSQREEWRMKSNAESGDGYSDILIMDEDSGTGIVIEVKYSENNVLDIGCREALDQIREKSYEAFLVEEGMTTIIKYGIAFFKKNCRVVRE